MKLQTQYSKVTILSSIVILLMAGIGYYFLLHYVLEEQLDGALRVEEVEILDYVKKKQALPEASTFKDQRTWFKRESQAVVRRFSTLKLYDQEDNNYELSRQLVFPITVNGSYYAGYVAKSQEETEDLVVLVLLITAGLLLLLGILLFFFNRFILKRLWRPFYEMLSSIKNFDLNAPVPVKTLKTSIDEFREMNESVNMMTEKVLRDYISLKNFTDHASHEIQTPLAVINSRLDILIQDPGLNATSLEQVQSIYNAIGKISRICQSLLLLTKIENNQFTDSEPVNIKQVVVDKLTELEEWINGNALTIKAELKELTVAMNDQLADTLITNLILNSIKYSKAQETIYIRTETNYFSISNPGVAALDAALIFDRFWKSDHSEGTGLGLAIAKQICDKYGFELTYQYREEYHVFKVLFNRHTIPL